MLFYKFGTLFCQCSNSCRCCIKLSDFMFFYNIPKTTKIWITWYAFKHYGRCSIGKWAVNNITMTRNPTNISCTPIDVIFFILKYVFKSISGIDHITCTRMHHPFWHACRARCIKYKQWIFCIHNFGITVIVSFI